MLDVRDAGWDAERGAEAARIVVARYRDALVRLSELTTLESHFAKMDETRFFREHTDPAVVSHTQRILAKARKRTHAQAVRKWVTTRDGRRQFIDDPPLLTRLRAEEFDRFRRLFHRYRDTLREDRSHVLARFDFRDVARKVVGVGSVGLRAFIVLLEGPGGLADTVILQVKEATASVLSPHLGPSGFDHHGKRVVVGQRLMQAASDPFLGWVPFSEPDFYVRQLRDNKGPTKRTEDWDLYRVEVGITGGTLARAHARTVDPAVLRGYVGTNDRLSDSLVIFGRAYADQVEADHERLGEAARRGDIPVQAGV